MDHGFEHLDTLLKAAYSAALDFLAGLRDRPAAIRPGAHEPAALPEKGHGAEQALGHFRERFEGGLSGSPGPRYLGFVTGGSTPAALAGDWLAAAYDQNLSNDGDSVATTVELEALGLLRSLFSLPETFAGAFVSGATQANMVALATARQWAAHRAPRPGPGSTGRRRPGLHDADGLCWAPRVPRRLRQLADDERRCRDHR